MAHVGSVICRCGHPAGMHYSKHYRLMRSVRSDDFGNVSHYGCEGCEWLNGKCAGFIPLKVTHSVWTFENDLAYDIRNGVLKKIYIEEIRGIMTAYGWILKIDERYLQILKDEELIINE